jgi:hypothetical protein
MLVTVPYRLKVMTDHMQRIMEGLLSELDVVLFQNDTAVGSNNVKQYIQ